MKYIVVSSSSVIGEFDVYSQAYEFMVKYSKDKFPLRDPLACREIDKASVILYRWDGDVFETITIIEKQDAYEQ